MKQDSSTNYLKQELDTLLIEDPKIFQFIEEASLDGLWYWDLENMAQEWMSRRFWLTLGYDPDEMPHEAAAWMDIINPQDLALAQENVGKHLADANFPYDQIVRYRHKQGHTVTVRCRGLAIRDAEGKPIRMLGAHNDLTRERRVENLLTETNRAARVGSWEYNVITGELYWSDVTREIHEVALDFEAKVEQGVSFYKEGYSRERIQVVLAEAMATGASWNEELQLITAKGNTRWVRAVGRAEQFNGETTRIYGSFQDIHDAKLRDLRLKASEELLRLNFESAPNGMVITDPKGRFTRISNSFADMLGYTIEELSAMSFSEVMHPTDLADTMIRFASLETADVNTDRMEIRFLNKNGDTVYADTAISAMRNLEDEISSYHAQIVDITAKKLSEIHRQRMIFLEDKAKEMEQFAYIASHDLRQPVVTIQGYVQALKEDFGDNLEAGAHEYLDVVQSALERMDSMIKGLLDYSRLSQSKQLQRVDLDALLAEVIADLSVLILENRAEIKVHSLKPVYGYPLELRQLFQNLVANAIQYHKPNVPPRIEVKCVEISGGHKFCVEDNGIGIKAGDQSRVFALFQRIGDSHKELKGTGIGLANCRTIVERHGGTIWVESEPKKGSTFHFTVMTDTPANE